MEVTYLTGIIAKLLALADGVVSYWTTEPKVLHDECGPSKIQVSLNECGEAFAESIRNMTVSTVEFINSIMSAMGAGNY